MIEDRTDLFLLEKLLHSAYTSSPPLPARAP